MDLDEVLGLWQDRTGRIVFIESSSNSFLVTISPSLNQVAYEMPYLLLEGKSTYRLAAAIHDNPERGSYFMVEAGIKGIGPVYNLYPAMYNGQLALLPEVGIGLHDDYEDDMGAPWAFPLEIYYKCTAEQLQAYMETVQQVK